MTLKNSVFPRIFGHDLFFAQEQIFKGAAWTMALYGFPLSSVLTRTQSDLKGTVKLTVKYIHALWMSKELD